MKTKVIIERAGWAVAAGLAVLMAVGGFQATVEKTGVVDLNKVIQTSELGKANSKKLNDALALRRGLIDFVNTYKVLTNEQATMLRELTLKKTPVEADKTQIEKIKQDVMASDRKRNELLQKATLTDSDRQLLQEYSQRAQTMAQVLERWDGEFTEELGQLESDLRTTTIDKAKTALTSVAKAGGFTVIHEATVAPYGVNDVTDACVKALNAQN